MDTLSTEQWIEELKSISVAELRSRMDALEETFGVSPQAQVITPEPVEQPQEEEPSAADVVVTALPAKRVPVIKVVRKLTGKPLKEAKGVLDELPVTLATGLSPADAQALQRQLEEVGATVELK